MGIIFHKYAELWVTFFHIWAHIEHNHGHISANMGGFWVKIFCQNGTYPSKLDLVTPPLGKNTLTN